MSEEVYRPFQQRALDSLGRVVKPKHLLQEGRSKLAIRKTEKHVYPQRLAGAILRLWRVVCGKGEERQLRLMHFTYATTIALRFAPRLLRAYEVNATHTRQSASRKYAADETRSNLLRSMNFQRLDATDGTVWQA